MDIKELKRSEVLDNIHTNMKLLNEYDMKWMYCYFNGLDKWPIIIDDREPVPPSQRVFEERQEQFHHQTRQILLSLLEVRFLPFS